ncbi:MAG TPA: ABC transporter substrate-binding protein [Burkholderiaceae bacterium]|nr:ABC transporter substrate-binding protein [Burkholderiaceae bacterium]HMX11398.1 ABC transporter substrate-binding protein [Burkholderiaceae bacterium]
MSLPTPFAPVRLVAAVPALATGLFGLLAVLPGSALAQEKLNMLCTANQEWCQVIAADFQRKTGVQIAFTRKGTGEAYAQLKAEADNPKVDIWWGGTGDPHLQAAEEKLTQKVDSPMLAQLQPWAQEQYKRAGGRTVGIYLGVIGLVYNQEVLAKKGLKPPACWADLLKPEYKGEIQMANPNSSGTAYTSLATWVQLWGEDKAFDYMKKLHPSINQYTKQGPAPGMAAARGETGIAITFLHDGVMNAQRGFPVVNVAPCEGTGYEIGSMSIVDGARNLAAAKRFYDFALSVEGQATALKGESYQLPSNKGGAIHPKSPDVKKIKLINYDFAKYGAATERKRLLTKWDAEVFRAGAK